MKFYRKIPYHLFSLGLHGLVFAIFFLFSGTNLFSGNVDKSKVRIVGEAIRVDLVAMPKMTIQELKNYEEAPGKEEVVVEKKVEEVKDIGGDEKVVLEKKVEKKSFQDMMKNLSKREVEKNAVKKNVVQEKDVGAGGISGAKLKKIMTLGNKLSEGTSLYGNSGANTGDLLDKYSISITAEVRKYWILPGFLTNKDFSCHIQVFISPEGQLLKAEIIKQSGSSDYDQRALNAIRKVSNFPKPDKEIANMVSVGQIALAFPL